MTDELKKNEEIVADAPAEATETPTQPPIETPAEDEVFAKSGKRSKKHIEEVKAEEERQERIASDRETPTEVKKGPRPVTRPRIERRGKKYQEVAKKIDQSKLYPIDEAVKLALATSPTKFDATVELHARLNVDPRQADQNIRAVVKLPHGT
ncbi:50S ribosomal protein L1, partial [Candidatus Saccharibacteria bacterium]|nr:50S ribosomal protein L1 [Candidatus Saccharibacteria bacterium]